RRSPIDGEPLERHLREDAARDDEREQPAEQEVEEVVAGVDRGEADTHRQQDDDAPLACEPQPARRSETSPQARPEAHVGTATRPTISPMMRSASVRWRPSESCDCESAMRCARHDTASALMSSGTSKSRPAASAVACAARCQASAPRVDTPIEI